MVTIFHLLMVLAVVGGAALGAAAGWNIAGILGAVVGTVAGVIAGGIVGQIPIAAGMLIVGRRFEKMTTSQLRAHLHDDECSTPNLVLLELRRRGEPIEDELPFLHTLLTSEDVQQRTRGWAALRSAFPELAEQMPGYNPLAPTDQCCRLAAILGDGDGCTGGNAVNDAEAQA
jgi:hypothetical protein